MPEDFNAQFSEAIESFFAEFRPETRRLITEALLKSGELGTLLRSIGAPDPGNSDEQYLTLLNTIRRMGESRFREKVAQSGRAPHPSSNPQPGKAPGPSRGQRPPMAQQRPEDKGPVRMRRVIAPLPERKIRPVDPNAETRELSKSRPGSAPADAAPKTRSAPGEILPIEPEEQTPEPATPAEGKSAPRPQPRESRLAPERDREAGAHLEDWDGAERRVSGERRSGADRRKNVELIFKNKRYGRDRRSGEERRRNWPPGTKG